MSVRSFRPVVSVATVAVAALGCYLVSLRVAAERAGLEEIENQIVLAQRDIRLLQTEIGTRGRLEQLERWNVKVLALSAPKAEQFVDGGYQLARLARPTDNAPIDAPVVLASAPKPSTTPLADGDDETSESAPRRETAAKANRGPASLLHVASYSSPQTATAAAKPAVSTNKPTNLLPKATKSASAARPLLSAGPTEAKPIPKVTTAKRSFAAAPKEKATH